MLAAFSANATVWADRTVFDTGDFVATADRVINEPAVQDRIAERLATRLLSNEEVRSTLRAELPERAQFLAPVILDAGFHAVHNIILRFLQNDSVQAATNIASRASPQVFISPDEGPEIVTDSVNYGSQEAKRATGGLHSCCDGGAIKPVWGRVSQPVGGPPLGSAATNVRGPGPHTDRARGT